MGDLNQAEQYRQLGRTITASQPYDSRSTMNSFASNPYLGRCATRLHAALPPYARPGARRPRITDNPLYELTLATPLITLSHVSCTPMSLQISQEELRRRTER